MANITITPTGAAFNPTDTVTSTRLNEARNPTAALTTGSIVPTDLSTGAPNWDSSGTLNVIGNLASSSIFTSGEAIEINQSGTGDRNAYVDFHTADPSGTDFNARIYRSGGLDSDLQILNSGTGSIVVNSTVAQINNNPQSVATKAYVDEVGAFTPSTYTGGESVTFPNGLIMKMGSTSSKTLNFVTPFPGGVVSVTISDQTSYGDTFGNASFVDSSSASGFTISSGISVAGVGPWFWQAIGY